MRPNIQRTGQYVLYDTTQRYRMISLDEQDFFVWRGVNRLELSDPGHEAAVILHQGDYLLFILDNEAGIHLACQEGALYRVYKLPQGLPSEAHAIVDIEESSEMLPLSQLTV